MSIFSVFQRMIAVSAFLVVVTRATQCTYDTGHGATYDLSQLTATYEILDDNPDVSYSYTFGVCNNVPSSALTDTGCAGKSASPAYQMSTDDNTFCELLGGDVTNALNYNFMPHDPEDPSAGVVLQYTGGDSCYTTGGRRKFDIHFICRDDPTKWQNVPTDEFVEEPNVCEYELTIYSSYGCPQECPRNDNLVCSGRGVCGYDHVAEVAKCFCDDGYTSANCGVVGGSSSSSSSSSSSGLSGTHSALIVMCILLAGVVMVAAYMFNKLRKLQLDPDAYSALGNRFNELGQVSEHQENRSGGGGGLASMGF